MITKITDGMVGKKVTCKIYGQFIKDAKIQESGGKYYICQNERDGARCQNRLGYLLSWGVASGDAINLLHNGVSDLKLNNDIFLYDCPPAEGDVLLDHGAEPFTVIGIAGKVVFLQDSDGCVEYDTVENLHEHGFTYVIKDEVEELTMEELCKELGRPVKIVKG